MEEGRRQPRDRIRRLLAYYGTAVRAVWRTPLAPLGVEVDGILAADQAVLVTVANVETYRDFLRLTPTGVAGRRAPRRLRRPADLEVGPRVAAPPAQAAAARPLEGRIGLPRAQVVVVPRRPPRDAAGRCGGCCRCCCPRARSAARAASGSRARKRSRSRRWAEARPACRASPSRREHEQADAIHPTWRARRTKLNASPAPAPRPMASNAAAFALSKAPRLAGTRKVAKRTPAPSASMTVAVTRSAEIPRKKRITIRLDRAEQPAGQMEPGRQREPPPVAAVVLAQRGVELAAHSRRAAPPRTTRGVGPRGRRSPTTWTATKPTTASDLDHEQPEHRGDHARVGGGQRPGERDADRRNSACAMVIVVLAITTDGTLSA